MPLRTLRGMISSVITSTAAPPSIHGACIAEMTASKLRLLLVEDDSKIARAVEEGLSAEGYSLAVAITGEDGFFRASSERYDLILLDLMLPGRSGLEILEALRRNGIQTPVLVLTARDGIEDRVAGLDAGADDYLVKPFAFPELVARVRALTRRGSRPEVTTQLVAADLRMDLLTRRVERGQRVLELTAREFDLLEFLLRNHPHIVSREMIARDVWKETARATSLDNVIDVHIARLRKKVDEDGPRLIHTVRGVGFVLREDGP
jgi:two-component system, OmpR family, copper resistance phosphate regulon response regulator CusR